MFEEIFVSFFFEQRTLADQTQNDSRLIKCVIQYFVWCSMEFYCMLVCCVHIWDMTSSPSNHHSSLLALFPMYLHHMSSHYFNYMYYTMSSCAWGWAITMSLHGHLLFVEVGHRVSIVDVCDTVSWKVSSPICLVQIYHYSYWIYQYHISI